jgi:putative N-acetylmannosamine-6-phosphate epimerase
LIFGEVGIRVCKEGFYGIPKKKRDFYEVGMICVLLGVIVDGY